jgi:hypothetical protein
MADHYSPGIESGGPATRAAFGTKFRPGISREKKDALYLRIFQRQSRIKIAVEFLDQGVADAQRSAAPPTERLLVALAKEIGCPVELSTHFELGTPVIKAVGFRGQ